MTQRWRPGEVIVRREVLGLGPTPAPDPRPAWYGKAWLAMPVYVVEDTPERLVTYVAPGAPLGHYGSGWPTPDGLHPWRDRTGWEGHGCLMVQRPEDHCAVWHLWEGPDRQFVCWYINLQAPPVRTAIGYDTKDFELDLVVLPDGTVLVKDQDLLWVRVEEGQFTPEMGTWVERLGEGLRRDLEDGRWWWDRSWAEWEPDPTWEAPPLASGWEHVPTALND